MDSNDLVQQDVSINQPEELPPVAPTRPVKDRITVVEMVYHQHYGDSPTSLEHRYTRWLDSDEQVFTRRSKAIESWEPVDYGWIDPHKCGLLVLTNQEGNFTRTNPTDEEREEAAAKVIELAYETLNGISPPWYVLPGESMRAHPSNLDQLMIRSQSGKARYTLNLYPA